uniref:Uncharacterized protein n=1 Tax=Rhizophora mucronata TaxID=61149 RepID=A0A2P2K3D6_RHIMU
MSLYYFHGFSMFGSKDWILTQLSRFSMIIRCKCCKV